MKITSLLVGLCVAGSSIGLNALAESGLLSADAFIQQGKLTAVDGTADDFLGRAVALSSDGNTAIVGAYAANVAGDNDRGAAYVFTRSGVTWTEQEKLIVADGAASDYFGRHVALSSDGNVAIVGANGVDVGTNNRQGAAYVFTRSGTAWTQQEKLVATDGAASDYFGYAVALSSDGDTAIAGACYADVGGNNEQGAAYVFTRSGASWSQQAKLTASDGDALDVFGWSVALSSNGNTAIAGASRADGTNAFQGAAYVFTRSGATWSQQAKLISSDGATLDWFGWSVALSSDGDTAIAGAVYADVSGHNNQGVAYVFTRSGTSWSQQEKLISSDGAASDAFGWSVALSSDGDTAIAGAYLADVSGHTNQGAAYVFTRSGTAWSQQQKLTATNGAMNDKFGVSVALNSDGNTAIAGAYYAVVGWNTDQGAAYVFTRSGTAWSQQAKLTAADGAATNLFGVSVALSGDGNTALAGSALACVAGVTNQGAAYVFTRSGTSWSEQEQLVSSDGAMNDQFGISVALSGDGNTALAGANYADVDGNANQGAAYVFAVLQPHTAAIAATYDYDGDGKADLAVYSDGYWSIYSLANGIILNNAGLWVGPGWTPVQ